MARWRCAQSICSALYRACVDLAQQGRPAGGAQLVQQIIRARRRDGDTGNRLVADRIAGGDCGTCPPFGAAAACAGRRRGGAGYPRGLDFSYCACVWCAACGDMAQPQLVACSGCGLSGDAPVCARRDFAGAFACLQNAVRSGSGPRPCCAFGLGAGCVWSGP